MNRPDDDATLPPPSDPDATLAPSSAGPLNVDTRAPAGYVIENELGRGGMGVVYLARDTRLNRLCALKMILSGVHSGDAEVERFRTEAQAIARLQHPGIVQVFEIGEHDDKPFMALEFCGGGSLDAVLAKNPLPAKDAAKLVKSLAEAMQAAHEARVIHRDLKPANVLLTDRGEPKITDFGLAKKLDESGATRTGSIMGTPSYMPPEQANGKKDIGPAADIYALGAILYECLAGRPPFRAATALDTILQVVTEDPVPLRQLNAKVPRDLETIAHKCLQKDPRNRYATAQDLANDLARHLAGEPILARPVGTLERVLKWVRRNPAVAGLSALVFLAMAIGTAVSISFAAVATREAEAARKRTEEVAAGKAQYERLFARGLSRPFQTFLGNFQDAEIGALWELSTNRGERMHRLFVEEAIRTPETTRQLKYRSEPALHAAVGLDPVRRAEVELYLLERLLEPGLDPEQRTDLAYIAANLGGHPPEAAGTIAKTLVQGATESRDIFQPGQLAFPLGQVARNLKSEEAARFCLPAAEALAASWRKMINPSAIEFQAGDIVAALVAPLDPKDAGRLAEVLQRSEAKLVQASSKRDLFLRGLVVAADRMEPQAGTQLIASTMEKASTYTLREEFAKALATSADRLTPESAGVLAESLSLKVTRTPDANSMKSLAIGLAAVSARLGPDDAARFCLPAAGHLAQGLPTADQTRVYGMSGALQVLAERVAPADARKMAQTLAQTMTRMSDPDKLHPFAEAVAALARRTSAKEAETVCMQAAESLAQRLEKPGQQQMLVRGLVLLTPFIQPKGAADLLVRAVPLTKDLYAFNVEIAALEELSRRLTPDEALQAGTSLAQSFSKAEKEGFMRLALANGVGVLAGRLPPAQAEKLCLPIAEHLSAQLSQENAQFTITPLGKALAALAERVRPADSTRLCGPVVGALLAKFAATETEPIKKSLAEAIAALAPFSDTKKTARALAAILSKTQSATLGTPLAQGIVRVAPHLESADALKIAETLTSAVVAARYADAQDAMIPALLAVVVRLEQGESSRLRLEAFEAVTRMLLKSPAYLPRAQARTNPTGETLVAPLAEADLIEALKLPSAVGPARRTVLALLANRHRRPFHDHWDFVRHAAEQNLGHDLTSPPRFPARAESHPR